MAITAETRTDIIELAVTALNAAPGTTLLNELVAIVDGGGTLADVAANLAASDTFTARYPAFQTAEEFADEWLGNLIPEAGADAMAEAKALVVAAVNGGTTAASLLLQAQAFLSAASESDAAFGTSAANFNNKVEVATHHTISKEAAALDSGALSSVTSDDATVTTAKAAVDSAATPGSTFTLTTGVDTGASFTGTAGDDTFNATAIAAGKATLTSGDSMTGGEGTDRLSLTSSVAGTYGGGAIGNSIEELAVTATAATVVDAALMTSVTDVYSIGSTAAGTLTVSGAAGIPNVHMSGTNGNVSVTFANASVNGGAADANTVALSSSGTVADTSVTVNGVETINAVTSGGMSGTADSVVAGAVVTGKSVTLTSDTLTTLNVTGTAGARIITDLQGATTTVTGTITSADGADDISFNAGATDLVSVDMGAGNDTVRLQTAPGLKTGSTTVGAQTIAGGDGTDTLVTGVAVSKAGGSSISGFETVRVTNGSAVVLSSANNDISHVILDGTGASVTGAEAGATIDLTTAGNATLDKTTTGAITVNVGNTSLSGAQTSTLTANGVTTATINNLSIATDTTSARSAGVSGAALTEMTVTGSQPTTITGGGAKLAKIDASAVSKDVTFSATLKATGAELIGGAGNDSATGSAGVDTLTGGAGNDTLSGGAGNDVISGGDGIDAITGGTGKDTMTGGGGADTFSFASNATTAATPVTISTSGASDTITDFTSGTDKIAITGANAPVAFLGNFANITAALAAQNNGDAIADRAAFVTGENALYVFNNTNGTLNVDDTVIVLSGVSEIAAGDLLLGSQGTGNTVTISAAAASVATTGTPTNANKNTTDKNDTIVASVAELIGSTLTGGAGTDTISLSIGAGETGTVSAANIANISGFETYTFANRTNTTADSVDYSITIDDANIGANNTVTFTSNHAGVAADGSLRTTGFLFTATAVATASSNVIVNGAGAHDNLTGGAGNDTLSGGDGNDTITGGTGTDKVYGQGGDDQLTSGAVTDLLDGGAGNDTVIASGTFTGTLAGGAGAADILRLNATSDLRGATVSGFETLNLNLANAATTFTVNNAQLSSSLDLTRTTITAANTTIAVDASTAAKRGGGTLTADNDATNWTITSNTTVGGVTVTPGTAAGIAQSITGGDGADTIDYSTSTSAVAQTLIGGAGNDTIKLSGGTFAATDVITGGAGTDTLVLTGNTAISTTTITGVTTVENLTISNTTTAVDLAIPNTTVAAAGSLTITTAQTTGALTINGSSEADGSLVITGGSADDTLTGGGIADTINGGAGSDTISGGAGADTLNGDANNDQITVGLGADTVTGGTGSDTIIVAADTAATSGSWFTNVVTDFTVGASGDKIKLTAADNDSGVAGVTTAAALTNGAAASVVTAATATLGSAVTGASTDLSATAANLILVTGTTGTSLTSALNGGDVTVANAASYYVGYYDSDLTVDGTAGALVLSLVVTADTTLNAADTENVIMNVGMTATEYGNLVAANFGFVA
jgi:Ca2+-binding RTX toxin-like protein